jgi:protein-tyrosine phosphatase
MAFGILFVCSANVCRSPLAETVARRSVGEDHATEIEFASAGVRARTDSEPCPVSARWRTPRRRQLPAHTSRPVTPDLARSADLIVAMDRETTGQLLTLSPGLRPRTFTLLEVVTLIGVVERPASATERPGNSPGGNGLHWLAHELDSARGLVPVLRQEGGRPRWRAQLSPFDIPDVHRTSWSHRQVLPTVAAETRKLVGSVLDLL